MQLPSNKVGLVLIIVVLFVMGTILFSKIDFTRPVAQLETVELVIARNTDKISNENWLDKFNNTQLRDMSLGDPLFESSDVKDDSITSSLATDLFSEYLILKQKGLLSAEDEAILTESISQKITEQSTLKNIYELKDILKTESTAQTIQIYGERIAQITMDHFVQMDTFKNQTQTTQYFTNLANQTQIYIDQLLQVSTPSVLADAHTLLINSVYQTKVFFETLANSGQDPAVELVIVTQYQARPYTEDMLYTQFAQYFTNNGILFETESTNRFWNIFK